MSPTPHPTDYPTPAISSPGAQMPRQAPQTSAGKRRTRGTGTRVALAITGFALVGAMAMGGWALDRFVIDHVEIADVASYEEQLIDEPSDATSVVVASGDATEEVTTDASSESAPLLTDTTYQADGVSIEISSVVVGSGSDTVSYYVADVVVDDATDLRAGFAENSFGTNIVADTSDIAEQYDAVFAINGDYYGFRDSGIVIRNGVVYRDDGARTGLAIYDDGTMAIYDETTTSAAELLADGAWNTWSFGPALVDDGVVLNGIEEVEVDTNFGNHSIQGEQPRTGIGIIDTNHFVFVIVDGRSPGYSRGVTMTEFGEIFVELGAETAYNLDGGGSATMYFNGDLVNNPLGRGEERGTSDIIYVGGSA